MLFVFVINCGINYHRESFSEKSGLKIQTYSVKDLQATCQWLTEEVNRLSTQVERTENGELQLPEEIRQEAVRSMQALGRQYPALQGYYPNPKAGAGFRNPVISETDGNLCAIYDRGKL